MNRQMFYHEGAAPFISSKIAKRWNKNFSNVSNKKDTKTDSVNAVQVSLSLARNMFLKYVTKSVFMKLQAFIKNGNEGLCNGVCF